MRLISQNRFWFVHVLFTYMVKFEFLAQLCKRLTSEHTNKLYLHKPESVLKSETHEFLRDYEI